MGQTLSNTLPSDRFFLVQKDGGDYLAEFTEDTPTGEPFLSTTMTAREAAEYCALFADGRKPDDWMTWQQLGTAKHVNGDSCGALECLRKAVSMHRSPSTLCDLNVVLEALGQFDEALENAEEAFSEDQGNQFAGLQLTNNLLRAGRIMEGFAVSEMICWDAYWYKELANHIPRWEGESLAGKSILVLKNGGYGDNILFMRQLRWLKAQGATVTYACPAEMETLVMQQYHIDWCLALKGGMQEKQLLLAKAEDFDCFVPMMSITHRTGPLTLEWPGGPYMHAEHATVQHNGKPLVGICWKAGEIMDPRKGRSLSSAQLSTILGNKAVDWISLSYVQEVPRGCWEPIPKIENWLDTANAIAGLDLVVTVDTGVAHLAAAMGKPTWVLLPTLSAWMYHLGSDTNPWYPTMRLFRSQGEFGITDETVQRAASALWRLEL